MDDFIPSLNSRGPLDAQRGAWRRSFLLALSAHLMIGAWLIGRIAPGPPTDERPPIQPLLRAAIAHEQQVVQEPAPVAEPIETAPIASGTESAQPDTALVKRTVRRALSKDTTPVSTEDAFAKLAEKAAVLEQISNSVELTKMVGEITQAMGVQPWNGPTTSAPAYSGPFDFDSSVLIDIVRQESGTRTTLREIFSQRDGRTAELVYTRDRRPDGSIHYQQAIKEAGAPKLQQVAFDIEEEDFNAVEDRRGPYEIIRKYPLMQQLHRTAVLPLLEKLAREEQPEQPVYQSSVPSPAMSAPVRSKAHP